MILPPVEIPEAEIVELANRRAGAEPKLRVVRSKSCFCTFTIDEHARAITCPRCGRTWEPFEALLRLSRDWTNYDANRRALKHEVKDLEERRERLRSDIQNLKAQAKRIEKKGPAVT
jgi:hypothetical protein